MSRYQNFKFMQTSEVTEMEKVIIPEKKIIIYTDGACSGNPGPGGYGAIILNEEERFEVKGGEKLTTNNKMELKAAIEALKRVLSEEAKVTVYTDSEYLKKGITEWIFNWKRKNYKDVKNDAMWRELDSISSKLKVEWHWVKAHAGNKYNEEADALARSALESYR